MSTDKSYDKNNSMAVSSPMSSYDDSNGAIIKSASIISLGTLTSRILGFIRDIILAKILGTAMRADAFFVAFRIPNLFRDIVGEGATNSAVVPVFSEYMDKRDKEELWDFVSVVLILSIILLSALTILGIAFAPLIVRVLAPGFIIEAEKLNLTIRLTRLMFPYLIFIGLTAYSMGILYSFRSFVSPAFSPCLLNIAVIVSALISSATMEEPVLGLAIGTLIGGVLQLLVQIRPMLKHGVRFKIPATLSHPGAKKVGKLLLPRIFGAVVYQLTVFIDTFCASLSFIVGAGGVAAIYYANRIIQFPMGIFSIAMASAILPTMSGLATRNHFKELRQTLTFSLKNNFFIMIPVSIFLVVLAMPIIRILFERGEFDQYSTTITSSVLFFLAFGLVSFGGIKILVTTFHSLQDTVTPVKVAGGCLVLNAILNLILMWPLKVGGIALASAIAGSVDFLILFYLISKRLGSMKRDIFFYILKVFLAAGGMGIGVNMSWHGFSHLSELPRLILVGLIGLLIYGVGCLVLRIEQINRIVQWILKKR